MTHTLVRQEEVRYRFERPENDVGYEVRDPEGRKIGRVKGLLTNARRARVRADRDRLLEVEGYPDARTLRRGRREEAHTHLRVGAELFAPSLLGGSGGPF